MAHAFRRLERKTAGKNRDPAEEGLLFLVEEVVRIHGLDKLPICMAKTHLSLSADAALRNAPEDFTLPVRDMRAYTGAGWLVPLCGDIQQMPGLGKTPAALNVDIDAEGRTVGLF